ncbi:hypothetical protein AMIS_32510 [Actinoplanes missouriensis 431]|uniref:HEAT repeat-containing protein n=1 Tax=Actinoplanes missouriensis (strain ATCC 14538 / DSM 43046 / CBS 188.64 / JCM 3121 / NBRC 102363 / NCIMB 12654 / NRRL B-3342 / UNCC 431) TaxID=512565 RepID=I0H634_ACTM4|nr:HEAT repeat domain-containing protein [Actinoplanes missouriensis]BAL88471.1 hypothetical protein AMIS_32510 [Actinoplanes missouriensis 431]
MTTMLESPNSSARLQAALAAGTSADPQLIDKLVERCGAEPDFFVRDMLTWALTRYPSSLTVPRLITSLTSPNPRARSQALHTLSKIGDRGAWPAITTALLTDSDDEVARTAWRTAVVLVPAGAEPELAAVLATQLGRGGRETQLSLSRAMIALGDVIQPLLETATINPADRVREHALATRHLALDPEAGFAFAVEEAKRIVALGPAAASGAASPGSSDPALPETSGAASPAAADPAEQGV